MAQFSLCDRARLFDQRGPSFRERHGPATSSSDGVSEHEALPPNSSVASLALAPAYDVHAFLARQEYSMILRHPDVRGALFRCVFSCRLFRRCSSVAGTMAAAAALWWSHLRAATRRWPGPLQLGASRAVGRYRTRTVVHRAKDRSVDGI